MMRTDSRWTSPLLAVLLAACSNVPDPGGRVRPPGDGESMQTITPPDDAMDGTPPSGDPSPPPSGARSCAAGGLTFAHGSTVPAGDDCNSCLCYDGLVVCTQQVCLPAACTSQLELPNGVCSRAPDDPCIGQDPDCGADAGADTAADAGVEPSARACDAAGQSFPDGADVPSGDSCNTCRCSDGTVACTEAVCDPVFCAEFTEEPDGVCSRFPLDPCIVQDPDCSSPPPLTEP